MADNHDPNGAYSEVFEDGLDTTRQSQTVHRIRANSSIMKLNKILGEYPELFVYGALELHPGSIEANQTLCNGQLPTVVKFVSSFHSCGVC